MKKERMTKAEKDFVMEIHNFVAYSDPMVLVSQQEPDPTKLAMLKDHIADRYLTLRATKTF